MRIIVTRVGGDGSVLTRTVDTARREDVGRWEHLAEEAALDVSPPYLARPGEPVYEIRAGEQAVQVAEGDLQDPLRELAIAVLTEGD